jgi:cell shape-determining protein MreC
MYLRLYKKFKDDFALYVPPSVHIAVREEMKMFRKECGVLREENERLKKKITHIERLREENKRLKKENDEWFNIIQTASEVLDDAR